MASCWWWGWPGAGPTISSWPRYSSRILRSSDTFAAVALSTRASLAEAVMVTIKCLLLGLGEKAQTGLCVTVGSSVTCDF